MAHNQETNGMQTRDMNLEELPKDLDMWIVSVDESSCILENSAMIILNRPNNKMS